MMYLNVKEIIFMKTLIVYTSQTGFTKKYAQWLSDEMKADMYDLKEVQKKDDSFFAEYDAIVYAGWAMAGSIVKVKWFLGKAGGWKDKKLAVICVGGSPIEAPECEAMMKNVLNEEQSSYIKAFYCQGGFNYEKMNGPSKFAMKMFANSLKKKPDENSKIMAEYISGSFDASDKKYIEPVVSYLLG